MKSIAKIFFVLALIALGNSLIIQPALELQAKHAATHADENSGKGESKCCFICHPSHHHWVTPNWFGKATPLTVAESFTHPSVTAPSDPPIGSIFRPPLAI